MRECRDMLQNVVYETDCQDLTSAWNNSKYQNYTYHAAILQECRDASEST